MKIITTAKWKQARAFENIRINLKTSLELFAETIIELPEAQRWKYAIPANYTNYQDGFLAMDGEPYRWRPMLEYNGETLYLYRSIKWFDLEHDEDEKLLLFDRHGNRYTFVVRKSVERMDANPSYFEFIRRVKKYEPSLRTKLMRASGKLNAD